LERKHEVSLDEIICDPTLVKEFDSLAASVAQGYTLLQYRWAALSLRKGRKLKPELLARVARPRKILTFRVADIELDSIPSVQGLYLFFTRKQVLYVGEAENLYKRIKKHLEHSDNKDLAHWFWEQGPQSLHLEIQVLSPSTETRIRRALELGDIVESCGR
jgi:hypothetical protein